MSFRISVFDALIYPDSWYVDVAEVEVGDFVGSLLFLGRDELTDQWKVEVLYSGKLVDWVKSKF